MSILLFFRRESRFSRILRNFFYNFHFLSSDRFDFTFTSPKKSENLICHSTSSCIFDKHVRVWERKSFRHTMSLAILWTKNLIKIPFFEIDWKISLLDLKSLSFQFHFFFKKWNQNVFTVHFSKKSESQNISLFSSRIKVKAYSSHFSLLDRTPVLKPTVACFSQSHIMSKRT